MRQLCTLRNVSTTSADPGATPVPPSTVGKFARSTLPNNAGFASSRLAMPSALLPAGEPRQLSMLGQVWREDLGVPAAAGPQLDYGIARLDAEERERLEGMPILVAGAIRRTALRSRNDLSKRLARVGGKHWLVARFAAPAGVSAPNASVAATRMCRMVVPSLAGSGAQDGRWRRPAQSIAPQQYRFRAAGAYGPRPMFMTAGPTDYSLSASTSSRAGRPDGPLRPRSGFDVARLPKRPALLTAAAPAAAPRY